MDAEAEDAGLVAGDAWGGLVILFYSARYVTFLVEEGGSGEGKVKDENGELIPSLWNQNN